MFGEAFQELKERFFGEKPPTDPDHDRARADQDGLREMAARAESFAQVGPVFDATLDPVTMPENVQLRARGAKPMDVGTASKRIHQRGTSHGLDMGAQALVEEAGWSRDEAWMLKAEVERGEMTEQQFKRVVESELERSETSGRLVQPPTRDGPRGVDRRRSSGRFVADDREQSEIGRDPDTGQFENVDQMARDGWGGGRL